MSKKNIDLSGIKESELEKTSSFTDIMTRSERKRKDKLINEVKDTNNDDIEDMVEEKKKETRDLTIELEKFKEEYKEQEEKIQNTQTLDITRQMKFNFEETKKENINKKKKGISILNIIGEVNLLCIGYYIYLLVFTNYQNSKKIYMLNGSIIVLLVLLFGLSVVTNKKVSKFFNILNILAIISFIIFNAYTLIR